MIPRGETTIKPEPLMKIKEDSQKRMFSRIFTLRMGSEVEEGEAAHNIWTFRIFFRTCLEGLLRVKDRARRKKPIKNRTWL
jgi:hypothetical protein